MASESFTKEFAITQQSTIDRIEKAIENIVPMPVSNRDIEAEMKKNEARLLEILRSKKSTIISSGNGLSDVIPFEWSDDVLSGNKKVIVSHVKD